MLVTFSSEAFENIVMFGDVAKALLRLMGHSGTVPGAFVAGEIPQALASLEQGLAKAPSVTNSTADDDENAEPDISLKHRAIPLINMLKSAEKKGCNIRWS
ncbi:MAG: DUF1840 domain-containing protein [Legionella sp.]|nr:MAG: DUF1840 domain-containing protein [Legionella sp.]